MSKPSPTHKAIRPPRLRKIPSDIEKLIVLYEKNDQAKFQRRFKR